jgi:transcriptional antiterminator NusG
MIITSESWYVVRNTRGVTGFVGPESKPVALTEAEVEFMLSSKPQAEATRLVVGEEIRILSGPLENFTGVVEAVDVQHGKLQVKVKMFLGREMQVEIEIDQAEKM